jgi:hypothetical protein
VGQEPFAERAAKPMEYSSILVVAPDEPGVNAVPEVDAISELGYRVRVLQGQVDDERLYRAVQDSRYDVVHLATHGAVDAVGMSNGVRLSRNAVLQVVRMSGARIAFLNACNSAQIGQMLVNVGLPVAVASVAGVDDDVARQTALTFYSILAQSGDITMAYKAACAGGDIYYVMLSNGGYAALQAKPVLERIARLEPLGAAIERSQADLRRLAWMVGVSAVMTAATMAGLVLHLVVR